MHKQSASSPEAVVIEAFRLFRNRDGHGLAAIASPSSLRAFRLNIISEAHPQWHAWTPEALRSHDPEMPLEVAEWRVKELDRGRADHEERLLARFPATTSIAELENLNSAELLHRALRGAAAGPIALGWCRVIGHVLVDDDRAYVLFWLGTEAEPISHDYPEVAALERIQGEWKLSLDPHSHWAVPGFRNVWFGEGSD